MSLEKTYRIDLTLSQQIFERYQTEEDFETQILLLMSEIKKRKPQSSSFHKYGYEFSRDKSARNGGL